jgi:hypothetical protein
MVCFVPQPLFFNCYNYLVLIRLEDDFVNWFCVKNQLTLFDAKINLFASVDTTVSCRVAEGLAR